MTDIRVGKPWWETGIGIRRRCPTCDSSFPVKAGDAFFVLDKKGRSISKAKAINLVCPVCGDLIKVTAPKKDRDCGPEVLFMSFLLGVGIVLIFFGLFA